MKNIVLGITGSIAAYKAADIARELTARGYGVHVIMTEAACEFITPLTLQVITGNKVHTDMFAPYRPSKVEHVSLAKLADLFLAAPATADFIAGAAAGDGNNLLLSVLLALEDAPVLIAPAMNTAMYEDEATTSNIEKLKARGFEFIEPKVSYLASGETGKGALADVDAIINEVTGKLE